MPMVTYPLNNIEYTSEDAELFHSTRTSGVYAIDSFDYSITGSDNNIVIGTGIGWIKNSEFSGKVVALKEPISLDMGLPDTVYPRIDAIVIQFDANRNETNVVVKKGSATSYPIAPSVVRTESVYELHLYHVRRNAGALNVSADLITDLRTNKNYCGLMSDSVTQAVDTTLSISGTAADAAAVGSAISKIAVESPTHPGCYYRTVNGVSEWLNPPMQLGVEYRTTERCDGNVVYTKLINCGTIPASGRTVTAHSLNSRIIRYSGSVSTKNSLPYRDPLGQTDHGVGNGTMDLAISGNNITIVTEMTDGTSPGTAHVQLWYVKD